MDATSFDTFVAPIAFLATIFKTFYYNEEDFSESLRYPETLLAVIGHFPVSFYSQFIAAGLVRGQAGLRVRKILAAPLTQLNYQQIRKSDFI